MRARVVPSSPPSRADRRATRRAPAPTGKTSSAGGRKKLTDFNKFMQTEVARLKQEIPDMPHKERCGTRLMRAGRERVG